MILKVVEKWILAVASIVFIVAKILKIMHSPQSRFASKSRWRFFSTSQSYRQTYWHPSTRKVPNLSIAVDHQDKVVAVIVAVDTFFVERQGFANSGNPYRFGSSYVNLEGRGRSSRFQPAFCFKCLHATRSDHPFSFPMCHVPSNAESNTPRAHCTLKEFGTRAIRFCFLIVSILFGVQNGTVGSACTSCGDALNEAMGLPARFFRLLGDLGRAFCCMGSRELAILPRQSGCDGSRCDSLTPRRYHASGADPTDEALFGRVHPQRKLRHMNI